MHNFPWVKSRKQHKDDPSDFPCTSAHRHLPGKFYRHLQSNPVCIILFYTCLQPPLTSVKLSSIYGINIAQMGTKVLLSREQPAVPEGSSSLFLLHRYWMGSPRLRYTFMVCSRYPVTQPSLKRWI